MRPQATNAAGDPVNAICINRYVRCACNSIRYRNGTRPPHTADQITVIPHTRKTAATTQLSLNNFQMIFIWNIFASLDNTTADFRVFQNRCFQQGRQWLCQHRGYMLRHKDQEFTVLRGPFSQPAANLLMQESKP